MDWFEQYLDLITPWIVVLVIILITEWFYRERKKLQENIKKLKE